VKGAQGEPPPPPLPKKAGLNRYVWNLRPEPMTSVGDTIRFVRNRPYRMAPGTYRVRLTANGRKLEQPLQVLPHPGLQAATQQQWDEQQRLCRRLYVLISDVHRETNELRALGDRARAAAERTKGPRGAQLKARSQAFAAALAHWEEHVPQSPLPEETQDRIGFPSRLLSTQMLHTLSILDGLPPVPEAVKQRVEELALEWARLKAEASQLRAEGQRIAATGKALSKGKRSA
jgi:hypothetical protein